MVEVSVAMRNTIPKITPTISRAVESWIVSRLTRNELASLRMAAGFQNAQAAATHLHISRIYLLELEQGRGNPSNSLLGRMAKAYGAPETIVKKLIQRARHDLHRRELARLKAS